VLVDDRGFFPPYDAAAVLRGAIARTRPEVVSALSELSGRLTVTRMRRWNARVEVSGDAVTAVATAALRELGLGPASTGAEGPRPAVDTQATTTARDNLLTYLASRRVELLAMTGRHILLTATSLGAAVLLGVPLGLWLVRLRGAETVIRGVGLLQTIPGLALLAFMLPVLGVGITPAVVALVAYSLYPIVRNTQTGVAGADPGAVAAATALGMTSWQVLRHVQLPLAAPVVLAGIRTAAVLNVGTATLGALIGAGGLGDPIVAGLALSDPRMVLSGALPAAGLALVTDLALGWLQVRATPVPLRAAPHA
jgi:osmoprotectant transport system permease protein